MPITRLIRPVLAFGILALGGCVAAPEPPPPGMMFLSQTCFAGFYQCILSQPGPQGAPCSCPGLGAPSFGTIR